MNTLKTNNLEIVKDLKTTPETESSSNCFDLLFANFYANIPAEVRKVSIITPLH